METGREVKKRVQTGWNGWRKTAAVTCDRKVSARTKGKIYKTSVRPAMLYGMETVPLTKKAGSGVGSSGIEDVAICSWSDEEG